MCSFLCFVVVVALFFLFGFVRLCWMLLGFVCFLSVCALSSFFCCSLLLVFSLFVFGEYLCMAFVSLFVLCCLCMFDACVFGLCSSFVLCCLLLLFCC